MSEENIHVDTLVTEDVDKDKLYDYAKYLEYRKEELLNINSSLQQKVEQQEKEIDRLNKEYERIYNENCKLRENHNINDITLLDENERLNNIIEELSKDVDMWNKKYNEQFDIINELEKWLEDNLGNCRTNQNYTSNQIYNLKEDAYYRCLNKLKELKENK